MTDTIDATPTPSIITKPGLILSLNGIMTLPTARKIVSPTVTSVSVTGATEVIDAYIQLREKIVKILDNQDESVKAVDAFDRCFKMVAQFRRDHRHELFLFVTPDRCVTVVDVDNLYIDRKSLGTSGVIWRHGVTSLTPMDLAYWMPEPPPGWVSRSWGELLIQPTA